MVLNLQLLQGLATIMGSLVALQVGPEGTPQMEQVGDTITQTAVVKVAGVVIAVGHIHHKDGGHHMAQVVCLVQVQGVVGVAVMELELPITRKVGLMEVLVLDVGLT